MKTRNQIKKIFEDFANSHQQINTFGYGEEFEQQAVEGVVYPLLWIVPTPYQINKMDCNYSYRCIVVDRVHKDQSNQIEVESDTDLIIKDLISYLDKYGRTNHLVLQDSFILTPTFEKWADEVSGWFTDIILIDTFDYSSCALPLADTIPSNEFPYTYNFVDNTIREKSFTILNPVAGDTAAFYSSKQIKINEIAEALEGTSPSVTYNIYYASTKNSGSPTKLWTLSRTATTESGNTTIQFDNAVIPANNWIWLEIEGKSGTVDEFFTTIFFKYII